MGEKKEEKKKKQILLESQGPLSSDIFQATLSEVV